MGTDNINLTWEQIEVLLRNFIIDNPSFLAGVTDIVTPVRGGLCPAVMLSHMLGITHVRPVNLQLRSGVRVDWESLRNYVWNYNAPSTLIVDDIVDSGETLHVLKTLLPMAKSFSVLARSPQEVLVDRYGFLLHSDAWVVFPWESKKVLKDPENC